MYTNPYRIKFVTISQTAVILGRVKLVKISFLNLIVFCLFACDIEIPLFMLASKLHGDWSSTPETHPSGPRAAG